MQRGRRRAAPAHAIMHLAYITRGLSPVPVAFAAADTAVRYVKQKQQQQPTALKANAEKEAGQTIMFHAHPCTAPNSARGYNRCRCLVGLLVNNNQPVHFPVRGVFQKIALIYVEKKQQHTRGARRSCTTQSNTQRALCVERTDCARYA